MSDLTRNKASERRFFEEMWSKGNFAILGELVAPDYLDHDAPATSPRGPEGLRQEVTRFRNAFSDLRFTVEDMVAEGDKVATRITATGTHDGDLPGLPRTGKSATIGGIVITRYENGKAAEAWVRFNFLSLYRQLGAMP